MSFMGLASRITAESINRPIPLGVIVVDGQLTEARLIEKFERDVCDFERFRSTVVENVFYPIPKEQFSARQNFRDVDLSTEGGSSEEVLSRYVSKAVNEPLDPSKPLWEIHVVRNLGAAEHEDKSAIIWRVHHCIADGFSILKGVLALSDESELTVEQVYRIPRITLAQRALYYAMTALSCLCGVLLVVLKYVRRSLKGEPRTLFRQPLSGHKSVSITTDLSVAELKGAGRAVRATLNDVALACVAGGMRRTLTRASPDGATPPPPGQDLVVTIAINLRGMTREPKHALHNRFGFVSVALPVGEADPVAALRTVKRRMDLIKLLPEKHVSQLCAVATALLPRWMAVAAYRFTGTLASGAVSNMRGPPRMLHFLGLPSCAMAAVVTPPADIGLGVGIMSYDGNLMMTVSTDEAVLPDSAPLAADIVAHFKELQYVLAAKGIRGKKKAAVPRQLREPKEQKQE